MGETITTMENESQEFRRICDENSLTPSLLKKIIYFKVKGINNSNIAKKLSVHRVTVQRYLEKMRKLDDQELQTVIKGVYIAEVQGENDNKVEVQ